jgi:chromate transporter
MAIFAFALPFPAIVAAAAVWGFVRSIHGSSPAEAFPPVAPLLRTALLWLAIWLLPLAALAVALGPDDVFTRIGIFFSKLAVVTFGGAYAVLSYMAQAAVEREHWLSAAEMIDGLALAETTPGPLILVTQFVGYVAAFRETGSVWGGIAGAAVTLWMTFAPCFLWILSGAPLVNAIGTRPKLAGALAAITAAVVGVILNLSLWFGLHVLFGTVMRRDGIFKPWLPDLSTLDPPSMALFAVASLALLRLHAGIPATLALCGALGFAAKLLLG